MVGTILLVKQREYIVIPLHGIHIAQGDTKWIVTHKINVCIYIYIALIVITREGKITLSKYPRKRNSLKNDFNWYAFHMVVLHFWQ